MKKKIYVISIILVIIASLTTITVLAKTFRSDWVERKINNGYSETDAYSMMAIMVLADENVSAFVEQKYEELGDWEKVAKHYNVDLKEFNTFVETQIQAAKVLEIPDDIYKEMKASGMNDEECKNFSQSAFNGRIDIEEAWEAKKNGKTINDLMRERKELKDKKAQAATDYTFGLITEEEYTKKMKSLSPDMPMSEIIEFAAKDRREWRELRIKSSGISEKEILLAEKNGVTDIFEMCRLKDAERLSNKTFSEMLSQVKDGKAVDSVIEENISTEKVEALKKEAVTE